MKKVYFQYIEEELAPLEPGKATLEQVSDAVTEVFTEEVLEGFNIYSLIQQLC